MQPDPIGYEGGSLNVYDYVSSDPLNLSDGLGLAGSPIRFNLGAVQNVYIHPSFGQSIMSNFPGWHIFDAGIRWLAAKPGSHTMEVLPTMIPGELVGVGLKWFFGGIASKLAGTAAGKGLASAAAFGPARTMVNAFRDAGFQKTGHTITGLPENFTKIRSTGTVTSQPDHLSTEIVEFKNVGILKMTAQLRSFGVYAERMAMKFHIIVHPRVRHIADSVKELVRRTGGTIHSLDPETGKFTRIE